MVVRGVRRLRERKGESEKRDGGGSWFFLLGPIMASSTLHPEP